MDENIVVTFQDFSTPDKQAYCNFLVGGTKNYTIDVSAGAQYAWKTDPESTFFFNDETVIQILSEFAEKDKENTTNTLTAGNQSETDCPQSKSIISQGIFYQLSFVPHQECKEEKETIESFGTFLLLAELAQKPTRLRCSTEKLYIRAVETEKQAGKNVHLLEQKLERVLEAYESTKELADKLCKEQKILCKKIEELEKKGSKNQIELQALKVAVFGSGFGRQSSFIKKICGFRPFCGRIVIEHDYNQEEGKIPYSLIFDRPGDYLKSPDNCFNLHFTWGHLYSFLSSHPRMADYKYLLSKVEPSGFVQMDVPLRSFKLTKEQEDLWNEYHKPFHTFNMGIYCGLKYILTEFRIQKNRMTEVLGERHWFISNITKYVQICMLFRDLLHEFQFRGKIIVPSLLQRPDEITLMDHPTDPNYVNTFCSEKLLLEPESFVNSRMFYHDVLGYYTTPLYDLNE